MNKHYDYLIVGAGLFGSVFSYEMRQKGKTCLVIDKRDHLAGNIYTREVRGIQVHEYGAHIFHTSNRKVWNYVQQFAEFNHFVNSPMAIYKNEIYNLPFNMNTFSKLWGIKTPAEAKAKIEEQIAELAVDEPQNLEEQALKLAGKDVYEKLVKGYTEKQWGRECRELPAFIIKRLPLRFTYDNNYFTDRYQGIPMGGYTAMIEKILDGTEVRLNTEYRSFVKEQETSFANGADAITNRDPSFWYLNYGDPSASKSIQGEKTRTAKYSYFGRVGYDFAGKYMLQASLRADAADLSYLPLEKRWGYFPAVSAGWTISEENFFTPLRDVVSSLKLRASWGQNGSLAALASSLYGYGTTMVTAGYYPFVPGNNYTTGIRPNSLGNDELKWETSEQINVGLDARLFNDRLTLSMDWFNKKTKDLLITGTTPSLIIGGTTSPINAGNVSNKGFEFEIGWRDNIGDFNYSIKGNLATLKNKVTYLDPSLTRADGTTFHTNTITYFEEGYPVYYFRGYRCEGINPEDGEPIFADLDNNGIINEDDKTYIGDAIPDFTYGLTLTAAWKGLDLTIFGSGSYGNDVFSCINRPDHDYANKLSEIFYKDRWTPEHTNATAPRANALSLDKYTVSDAMVFDGSYFKIKQIQLGYSLPKQWINKVFINNLRLYVSLEDFFTFTSYPGFDPEASANATSGMGIDMGTYPSAKKVMLGFNVEF